MSSGVYYRPHPVEIFRYIWKYLFLLLIPLFRGFLYAIQGNFTSWLQGAWMDIFIVVSILLIGILHWFLCRFTITKQGLCLEKGVLFRKRLFIPKRNIATLSLVDSFYLKPFRAVHLRADTPGGTSRYAEFNIIVNRDIAHQLVRFEEIADRENRIYAPRNLYILALSALISNSFAGIVLVATLISQSGKILGQNFSDQLYGSFEGIFRYLAFGIPPFAAAIAYLILLGWLVAFTMNVIRHHNFTVWRKEDTLLITGGIFTGREYTLRREKIAYLDVRQSVFTKAVGLYSAFVCIIGFGKEKEDLSTIVPSATRKTLISVLTALLPEFQSSPRLLKPNGGAVFRFLNDPFWVCAGIPVAAYLLRLLFPEWQNLVYWIGFMAFFPAVWFLIIRTIDFFTSGLSKQDDYYTLRYSSGFYLHTVIIPAHKIAHVTLRSSILQRMDKKCDVLLYSYDEKPRRHHLRNLDKQAAADLFGLDFFRS